MPTKAAGMASSDADAMQARSAVDYINAGDTCGVAHSKVVGGGETTSLSIPVARLTAAAAPLSFFCSFPGHATMMKGTVTLK